MFRRVKTEKNHIESSVIPHMLFPDNPGSEFSSFSPFASVHFGSSKDASKPWKLFKCHSLQGCTVRMESKRAAEEKGKVDSAAIFVIKAMQDMWLRADSMEDAKEWISAIELAVKKFATGEDETS